MVKLVHHLDACTVLSGESLGPVWEDSSTGLVVAHCSQRNSRLLGINFSSELMNSVCISSSHDDDDDDDLKKTWCILESPVFTSLDHVLSFYFEIVEPKLHMHAVVPLGADV